MMEKELRERTEELINDVAAHMRDNIDRAVKSGSMDIEGADEKYLLPKLLTCALLKDEVRRISPPTSNRKANAIVKNIYIML